MKFQGLDGREYKLRTSGQPGREHGGSRYHKRARLLLRSLFPQDQVLEEITISGAASTLYVDFFLPLRKIVIEVQGEQHYRFTPMFHRSKSGFLAALRRDQMKREWCNLNELTLIELPFHESDEQWRHRILNPGSNDRGEAA